MRQEASKADPRSAAKAAAMRALSKSADDDAGLEAPQKPAEVGSDDHLDVVAAMTVQHNQQCT